MRVRADQPVEGDQRAVVVAGGGDDQLVGRVAVEGTRQLGRTDSDLGRKREQQYRWLPFLQQWPSFASLENFQLRILHIELVDRLSFEQVV